MDRPNDSRTPRDEASLYAGLAANDDAACAEVLRRHGPALLAAARRIVRGEVEAQGALRGAFLALSDAARAGAPRPADLHLELRRLVLRECVTRVRATVPASSRIEGLLPSFDVAGRFAPSLGAPGGFDLAPPARRGPALARAIERLPEPQRALLLLCDVERLECGDAAQQLGLPLEAVRRLLGQARHALFTLLRVGGVLVPAEPAFQAAAR